MLRSPVRISLVALTLMALTTGCGDILDPRVCTQELGVDVSPDAPVLQVGQSVTLAVRLTSCGGAKELDDRFAWQKADRAVVTVDPRTGRVTAVGPGRTTIEVVGDRYGLVAAVPITVE